ncbi:MAG: AAA family ATPase [Myxococcaceae bacterium]|nr:AAA family ATPase [Myxococcaceae bacterium]
MRVTKLSLKKVGVFQDAVFEFPRGRDEAKADTYLFVGPNGSGKTTALLALAQFFTVESTGLNLRLGQRSESTLALDDGTHATIAARDSLVMSPIGPNRGESTDFIWWTDARSNLPLVSVPGAAAHFGAYGYSGSRSLGSFELVGIRELTTTPNAGALSFSADTQALVQWLANGFAKVAFARQRGDHALAEQRHEAIERVSRFIRTVTGASFELVLHDEPLAVRCKLDGVTLDLSVLPDGLKSILSLVGDLLMRIDRTTWPADGVAPLDREHLVFLDEVEVHLHPKWQRKVLPALQSLLPRSQVFATTHSPFVVASATDAFVYKLDAGHVSRPLSTEEDGIDAQSVHTILREVLDVDGEFSDAVEEELRALEEDCRRAVRGDEAARVAATQRAATLSARGPELQAIAQRQLRFMERQLARPPAA